MPPEVGNHDSADTYWISESMMPSAMPAAHAMPNEVKR